MLSILIPTYNYQVSELVKTLQKQASNLRLPFEIVVCDDASSDFGMLSENKQIGNWTNCHFIENEKNLGRTATRQRLAEMAKFENLLFLDADVLPKHSNFIEIYINELNKTAAGVIFGGIDYDEKKPEKKKLLRWKYGSHRERLSVEIRKKNPFLTINSGAFLINRMLFLKINSKMDINYYGMDILFTQLLKQESPKVAHIENPVIHLGLEDNSAFLKKSLNAVKTIVFLESEKKISNDLSSLQKSYLKLERLHLTKIFSFFVSRIKTMMEHNFLTENPNLFWFDLYRLNYYIQLKEKVDA
ncbi:glycosyltransferase family 2 protein [Aequorivita echinoideorum]|uniref:Glycosyltransferase family 2 protein n=1 Tax=Aequorivita echinoideorum TaxID=1549647 RepID=A0ABS5S6K4_9FLAO|nr:glycosyltransferase [Aequorivita echinoideorum]MBT0608843.1 glycosyltransferase family 2 protein [Aequorivita echinoideorum]